MFDSFVPFVNNMLDYTNTNSQTISNNIANVNTPGYKARQTDFQTTLANELDMPLHVSDEQHISKQGDGSEFNIKTDVPSHNDTRLDENNVDRTDEMIKMLKNNYTQNLSVDALNKEFNLYKTAMK